MNPDSAGEVIGRRVIAAFVDFAVFIVAEVIIGLIFGQGHAGHGRASVTLSGTSAVVLFVLTAAYFFGGELVWGRTLGKRLLGLRVVATTGARPSAAAVAIRTVLRVVDSLPFLYLLGLVSILATRRRAQRIGDLAARTTVVLDGGSSSAT